MRLPCWRQGRKRRQACGFRIAAFWSPAAAAVSANRCATRRPREGARVAVGDLDLERAEGTAAEIRRRKAEAHAFRVDVADPQSAAAFVTAAETALGRMDVLVNSAGIREIVSVLDLAFEEWQRVLNVNLTGTFLVSQAFARRLVQQGKSRTDRQPGFNAGADGGAEPRGVYRVEAWRGRTDARDGA